MDFRRIGIDFHHAVEQTLDELAVCTEPDGEAIHTALWLAAEAWLQCDPRVAQAARWDRFGTEVHAAVEDLNPLAQPITILLTGPLPDSPRVRYDAARLASAVAARLDAAAGDPAAAPERRWAWAATAARLRAAADDLASPP